MIDSCVITSLNSASNSLSYDIVRFKIEVGVEEKYMCKMYQNKRNTPIATVAITVRRSAAICMT